MQREQTRNDEMIRERKAITSYVPHAGQITSVKPQIAVRNDLSEAPPKRLARNGFSGPMDRKAVTVTWVGRGRVIAGLAAAGFGGPRRRRRAPPGLGE